MLDRFSRLSFTASTLTRFSLSLAFSLLKAVAVACLFLASKVEEKPLRLSDHIFLYFRLRKNKILKKTDQVLNFCFTYLFVFSSAHMYVLKFLLSVGV